MGFLSNLQALFSQQTLREEDAPGQPIAGAVASYPILDKPRGPDRTRAARESVGRNLMYVTSAPSLVQSADAYRPVAARAGANGTGGLAFGPIGADGGSTFASRLAAIFSSPTVPLFAAPVAPYQPSPAPSYIGPSAQNPLGPAPVGPSPGTMQDVGFVPGGYTPDGGYVPPIDLSGAQNFGNIGSGGFTFAV